MTRYESTGGSSLGDGTRHDGRSARKEKMEMGSMVVQLTAAWTRIGAGTRSQYVQSVCLTIDKVISFQNLGFAIEQMCTMALQIEE